MYSTVYFTVVLGLAVAAMLVPSCNAASSDVEFAKQCIDEHKEVLAHYGSEKGTCLRIKVTVNCLSKRREERGQLLDGLRYFFTQNAMFVSKMKICNDIDYKDLKAITDETDFAKTHHYLDTIQNDALDICAIDVYKHCNKLFLNLFSKDRKICDDSSAWIDCYANKASENDCKAPILKDFTKTLEIVGKLIIREIRRFAGIECVKMEL